VAHKYYASLEADTGQALAALRRLLGQAARHGNDPELFAGLVRACRYCGLYERSIAAHEEAHRLDPNVRTSLELTLLMAGKIEGLQASERPAALTGVDAAVRVIRLGLAGRNDDARRALHNLQQAERHPSFKAWADYLGAWLDRRSEDMARIATGGSLDFMDDPEATFHQGWMLCGAGDGVRGLVLVRRAVAKGYWAASTLADARQFDALRGDPTFGQLLAEAQAGRERALVAFSEAGGERLLGL
jgi:tetratricopeptide (TPR) repeat protein